MMSLKKKGSLSSLLFIMAVNALLMVLCSEGLCQKPASSSSLTIQKCNVVQKHITMYPGEVKVLQSGIIKRVAVGNPKVVSTSILLQGELVLVGEGLGFSSLKLWLADGDELNYEINVMDKKALDTYFAISDLVKTIPGIKVREIRGQVVVEGTIKPHYQTVLDKILSQYKDILNLVNQQDNSEEIIHLLEAVPGIKVRVVGDHTVIEGQVASIYQPIIKSVITAYPKILDLTRPLELASEKMIYMDVKIMEFSTKAINKFGIDWTQSATGPAAAFAIEGNSQASLLNGGVNLPDTISAIIDAGATHLGTPVGYIGIATEITSVINLLKSSGDAVILAEPRLSTKSGGKAEFLAGGEIPLPMTTADGQSTTEFKKYGITLNINPMADDYGNILAHIETEVSAVDNSITVNGIPGFLTRKTSTDISLKEKQTLVISGLVKNTSSKSISALAGFSEIPILGELFKSRDVSKEMSELVIFVTPTIYDAESDFNKERLERGEKIKKKYEILSGSDGILD